MRKLLIITLFGICFSAFAQNTEGNLSLENIDFSDVSLVGTDTLANAIVEYISACAEFDNRTQCLWSKADDIMMAATANPQIYNYVLRGLIEVFDALGEYKIVNYLVDMPYVTAASLNDDSLVALAEFAERFRKVKIGEQAPEIIWETIDGQSFVLSDMKSEFVVLAFLSLNCDHCREWLHDIRSFLKQHSNYKLVVWLVNGSSKEMKKIIRRNKLRDIVCMRDGMSWNSPIVKDFCVSSTPTILILNEKKIILDKPETIEDLHNFVQNNNTK